MARAVLPTADIMGNHALQAKEVIGIGSPAWLAGVVAAGIPVIQEHQKQQQKQQVPQSKQQQPLQVCHHGVCCELLYRNGSWVLLPGLCTSRAAWQHVTSSAAAAGLRSPAGLAETCFTSVV
jgi:hypothetical protein